MLLLKCLVTAGFDLSLMYIIKRDDRRFMQVKTTCRLLDYFAVLTVHSDGGDGQQRTERKG